MKITAIVLLAALAGCSSSMPGANIPFERQATFEGSEHVIDSIVQHDPENTDLIAKLRRLNDDQKRRFAKSMMEYDARYHAMVVKKEGWKCDTISHFEWPEDGLHKLWCNNYRHQYEDENDEQQTIRKIR